MAAKNRLTQINKCSTTNEGLPVIIKDRLFFRQINLSKVIEKLALYDAVIM